MDILIVDSFYEDSHRVWAEGLSRHSSNNIEILYLSPHHWKWRMTGGAVELAEAYKKRKHHPDLIIATDMLDLGAFVALSEIDRTKTSIAIYFHENQITYPWKNENSKLQKERNNHYGFINYTSCLVADKIFFNSQFHMDDFVSALPGFAKIFPRFSYEKSIEKIAAKSEVLPIGLDLDFDCKEKHDIPCFLWNHRWEYDKNPEVFFKSLFQLKQESINFKLIALGKSYKNQPPIFKEAKQKLEDEIIHFGFVDSKEAYLDLLQKANILLVTSRQDFFGISIVEAIAAGLYPLLPDRLAFPEHIPEDKYGDHFYQTDDGILPMLREIIGEKRFCADTTLPTYLQKYDWQNLIDRYDAAFEALRKESVNY